MQKIYFRADACQGIGYGHFIRSLALADMLKDDFLCTFFTVEPTPYQVSEMERVCPWQSLPQATALADFLNLLQGDEIVVLDNYFYTTDYQRRVKEKGCKLVVTDDMHNIHNVADVVISHGLSDPTMFDVEPYTRLCLGFDWALLRRPFLEAAQPMERTHITVCFGGSDQHDLTGKYIRMIKSACITTPIVAVVGDGYSPQQSKVEGVDYRSRLSAEQMAHLFRTSTVVVCSASSVCIEAFACGARVAAGWYVDNQEQGYYRLRDNGNIIPLGNLLTATSLPDMSAQTTSPISSANKIAQRYKNLFRTLADSIYLRLARLSDCDMIYRWANDPLVRENSFNSNPIPYQDHCQWFTKTLTMSNVSFYIMVADGNPVGQARLSFEDEKATIAYSIASEYRGKGYGNKIIELLEQEAKTMSNITKLVALVKAGNEPSLKVFTRNAFGYCKDISGGGKTQ